MIRSGFLSEEDRKALTALARDGSSPCRVTRRANALVLFGLRPILKLALGGLLALVPAVPASSAPPPLTSIG